MWFQPSRSPLTVASNLVLPRSSSCLRSTYLQSKPSNPLSWKLIFLFLVVADRYTFLSPAAQLLIGRLFDTNQRARGGEQDKSRLLYSLFYYHSPYPIVFFSEEKNLLLIYVKTSVWKFRVKKIPIWGEARSSFLPKVGMDLLMEKQVFQKKKKEKVRQEISLQLLNRNTGIYQTANGGKYSLTTGFSIKRY